MADSEHLEILESGVNNWNNWRKSDRNITPDLSSADLGGADLGGAVLSGAVLSGANLSGANLSEADLSRASLNGADLSGADLSGADLEGAYLHGTILRRANLGGAVLSGANLDEAYLYGANLSGADLSGADLCEADLYEAYLRKADLREVDLREANLREADLYRANLSRADLSGADLIEANLKKTDLSRADLNGTLLQGANLREANLREANLREADLSGADLIEADLSRADLSRADLSRALLQGANLNGASLILADIQDANLNHCQIYGVSVWDLKGEIKEQKDLVITPPGQPKVTVDNIKVAQFIYLLLENKEIRDVIETIGKKGVLVLGNFSEERKKVLDSLKDLLRAKGYLPILFDFEKPTNRDLTETIQTLASLSKFIIADITDARSIPQELSHIVPNFPSIPVKPIILAAQGEYAMVEHFHRFPWFLETYEYPSLAVLEENLEREVVEPAEEKLEVLKPK